MSNCCAPTTTSFADSVELSALLRHIAPELPEIPHDFMLDRVRQVYIEFARRSLLLTYKDTQDYQAGVQDYFFNVPTAMLLVMLS